MVARAPELDNLRGRNVEAFSVPPEQLEVVTDRRHPLFRESALEPPPEPLIASILRWGCPQALIARRDGTHLQVVDGRKRTLAARAANLRLREQGQPEVKCIITLRGGRDADLLGVSATLNAIRYQDSALECAVMARRMLDLGATLEDIAVAFGRSVDTIENWLKLDDLHPEVRELVRKGTLSYTVAMRLHRKPRAEQPKIARKLLRAGPTNANAVRAVSDGHLERVRPPDKQTQRRVADELLKAKAYAVGDQESDAFTFAEWILGRVSTDELLGCLRSGVLATAVTNVLRCRR